MSELTDAAARLQAATVAHAAAARELGAAVARQIADADTLAALATQVAALAGQEPPPSDGIPDGADTVKIGTASYRLSGVNPTPESNRAGWIDPSWAGRGPDQLVIYRRPLKASGTNAYGTEAPVERGVLGSLTAGRAGGIAIPDAPGYILSGHGKADDFLRGTRPGALVQVVKSGQPPPAVRRTIAGYLQDGQDVDTIPACYTQIRVAFVRMVGGVLQAVEWGGKTPAETQAQLTSWAGGRAGNQVLLTTGGQGGGNNFGLPSAFVAGYKTLAPKYAAHGVDADEEGQLDGARVVAVCEELHAADPSFIASFVPPGGDPVPVALSAAKQLFDDGVPVQFGFQGYEAVDSDDDILGRTADAVAALNEQSVLVGFMIGDDPKHRTPAECESLMRKVVTRWPHIGGAYFWQIHAPGTTDAAQRVAAVLGMTEVA